jgi:hypothetical protein
MISRGYVAVFAQPHSDASIRNLVASWLDRFSRVEQVIPGAQAGNSTVTLTSSGELLPSYLTRGRCVIETTGLPSEKIALSLDVLLELNGVTEIVDQSDDRRLDELERDGLM